MNPRPDYDRPNPGDLLGPAAFSPDGRVMAAAGAPCSILLFDTRTWGRIAALDAPEPHFLNGLRFSPDGGLLVACTIAHAIQLWDLRAIRARLTAMGVDWTLPPCPAEPDRAPRRPIRAEVVPGEHGAFAR
jgi:WD40 repeat protein